MKLWPRPTLTRRLFLALLVAFAAAGLALLALDYAEFKSGMTTKTGVQTLAEALAASIAEIDSPQDAALVMRTRAKELNRLRQDSGALPGQVEFRLLDAAGNTRFETPGAARAGANTHWLAQSAQGRWRVEMAEPKLADATVIGWFGRELLVSLLVAFPLVLLPLALALRSGLKPLKDLTRTVAKRSADDLSPLGLQPQHDELKALAGAFDALLGRLRQQRAAERALVQDAAHELRTPMAVVATQAHVLAHAKDGPERQEAEVALQLALQRAAHLSRQLLTLALLDAEPTQAQQEVDLAALVQQGLASLTPQAQARGLEFSLDAPDTLPARLDRAAFESILLNLVDNALRYVPAGGHVELQLCADDEHICLRVLDDGPGLQAAERPQAFHRFWRGVQQQDVPGSGLGLAIVREACARLGGQVQLQDGLTRGTHVGLGVVVQLPRVR